MLGQDVLVNDRNPAAREGGGDGRIVLPRVAGEEVADGQGVAGGWGICGASGSAKPESGSLPAISMTVLGEVR